MPLAWVRVRSVGVVWKLLSAFLPYVKVMLSAVPEV
jgi:hypothetical protein